MKLREAPCRDTPALPGRTVHLLRAFDGEGRPPLDIRPAVAG